MQSFCYSFFIDPLGVDMIRYGHFELRLYKPPLPCFKDILHEIKVLYSLDNQ